MSLSRPKEARELFFAVTDDLIDKMADMFGDEVLDDHDFWDWYEDHIEDPVKTLLCKRYGHEPVADQCNMPEHDHCAWCFKHLPHKAPRVGYWCVSEEHERHVFCGPSYEHLKKHNKKFHDG